MKLNDEIMYSVGKYDTDLVMEMKLYRIWLKRRSQFSQFVESAKQQVPGNLGRPKALPSLTQKIKYIDFIPESKKENKKKSDAGKGAEDQEENFQNSETIDDLVDKINEKIKNEAIGGRIINVQTIKCPADDDWQVSDLAESTDPKTTSKYKFILRLFYECGPPGDCLIGIKDFLPKNLPSDSAWCGMLFNKPKFDTQEVLLKQVSAWLTDNPELMFVNAKTISILLGSSKLMKQLEKINKELKSI